MAVLLAPIAINLDGSAFLAALEKLRLLALPKDVGEFLVGVFDTPDLSAHLGSVEQDDLPAFGASELRVHLKPSDRFLMLLSAVRAGEHPRVFFLGRNVVVDDPDNAIEIADQAADLRRFS
jgi:hypothetical protein